jgi:tetratricopeptide (TPR) repeat protein
VQPCPDDELVPQPSVLCQGTVTLAEMTLEEITRRELLARTTVTAMGVLAVPALSVLGPRQPANPAIVEHLHAFRRVLVEEDNLLGSSHLIGTVTERIALIDGMCRSAPAPMRSDLLRLGALYEELAGWLHQNIGNAREALWWSDRAIQSGHEADDQLLVSYVLMRKAQLAMDAGDASETIGLAQAAQRSEGLTCRVRAAAVQQEAHGHALAGNLRESERMFDQALHLVMAGDEGDHVASELGGFCTERHIEAQRATAMLELGQPQLAVSVFERELALWPASFERDRGLFLSNCALAHLANDDPDQAATIGRDAAQIAQSTRCARTLARLGDLDRRLASHGSLPAVQDFRESLATA